MKAEGGYIWSIKGRLKLEMLWSGNKTDEIKPDRSWLLNGFSQQKAYLRRACPASECASDP